MNRPKLGTPGLMRPPETSGPAMDTGTRPAVEADAARERIRRALLAVRSGGTTVDRAAAELAADPTLAMPLLFVRTLLENPGVLSSSPEAPLRLPGAPHSRHRAAWVPHEPGRDPEARVEAAVGWILERAGESGLPVVVLSPDRRTERSVAAFDRLRERDVTTTPRSPRGVAPETGPVLAYVPGAAELELAARLAGERELCVVESRRFPVSGWARHARALDLLRGEATGP